MKKVICQKKAILYIFLLGIFLILAGIFLGMIHFKSDTAAKDLSIKEATSYKSKKKALKSGEIVVLKDIKYESGGEYHIVYKSLVKKDNDNKLLAEKSNFTITDIIGEGYTLEANKIKINGKNIDIEKKEQEEEGYAITYNNNTFEISLPSNKAEKDNTIEIYIKLIGKESNKKYIVSKDSYYSFVPSDNNSFYDKKSMQSYIIEGTTYIILK